MTWSRTRWCLSLLQQLFCVALHLNCTVQWMDFSTSAKTFRLKEVSPWLILPSALCREPGCSNLFSMSLPSPNCRCYAGDMGMKKEPITLNLFKYNPPLNWKDATSSHITCCPKFKAWLIDSDINYNPQQKNCLFGMDGAASWEWLLQATTSPALADPRRFVSRLSLHDAFSVMFHLTVIQSLKYNFLLHGRSLHQDFHSLLFCSKEEYFSLL